MDTEKNIAEAVARFSTFSLLARNAIFQAAKRPTARGNADTDKLEDVPWIHGDGGDYRVLGRIGQVHARLFECLFKSTRAHMPLQGGGWNLLVDPAGVRSAFRNEYNVAHISHLRDDLALARIQLKTPRFDATGALIEVIQPKKGFIPPAGAAIPRLTNRLTHQERPYWFVRTGAVLSALIEHDYCLHIDTARVATLRSGMAQAIARHLLTQDRSRQPEGGWKLDNLIRKLAPGIADGDIRNRRREVRRDARVLASLEILTDEPDAGNEATGQGNRGNRAGLRLHLAGCGAEDRARVAAARAEENV